MSKTGENITGNGRPSGGRSLRHLRLPPLALKISDGGNVYVGKAQPLRARGSVVIGPESMNNGPLPGDDVEQRVCAPPPPLPELEPDEEDDGEEER